MTLQEKLDRLNRLVLDGGWDDESKRSVEALNLRFRRLAQIENLAANPVIKEYLDYMAGRISECETLLKSKRDLTDLQRNYLFAIIEVSEKFSRLFDQEPRSGLEQAINQALDAATDAGPAS